MMMDTLNFLFNTLKLTPQSEFIPNDPFYAIEQNAPEIFDSGKLNYNVSIFLSIFLALVLIIFLHYNLAPKPRRRMSELISNDPLREIEQHAPEIFDSGKFEKIN